MEGLERRGGPPRRVVVIGAGIAGLVAAYELARAGHDPLILEGQNRVGGRVHTLRRFAPGLYAEAGAMRIPRAHDLTLGYVEHFGLQLRPFVMGNPKGLVHVGGRRMTAGRGVARLVRRPLGERRVRPVRGRPADGAPGRHRSAGGADLFRRRALLAVPRVDPGRAPVRARGRASDQRAPGGRARAVTEGAAPGGRGSARLISTLAGHA